MQQRSICQRACKVALQKHVLPRFGNPNGTSLNTLAFQSRGKILGYYDTDDLRVLRYYDTDNLRKAAFVWITVVVEDWCEDDKWRD